MKKLFLLITTCTVGLLNVNAQTNLPGYGSGSSLNTTIGCGNQYYSHILTEASKFYFNKPITVNSGQIGAFTGNDLQLMTGTSYNTPGIIRMSISKSTGNVGIGTTPSSSDKLNVNGNLSVTNGNILATGGLYSSNRLSIYNGTKLATIKSDGVGSWLFDFDHKLVFRNNSQSWVQPLLLQGDGSVVINGQDDLDPNNYQNTFGSKLVVNGWLSVKKGAIIATGDDPSLNWNTWEARLITPMAGAWVTNETGTDGNYKSFGMTTTGWYFGLSPQAVGGTTTDVKYAVTIGNDGKLTAREILVTLSGWADFVFQDDYELKDLEDVESFIIKNKHLPDVPSEKEMLNGTVNLGEMDAILLQKIEELTLYTIELQKEVNELKSKNN